MKKISSNKIHVLKYREMQTFIFLEVGNEKIRVVEIEGYDLVKCQDVSLSEARNLYIYLIQNKFKSVDKQTKKELIEYVEERAGKESLAL